MEDRREFDPFSAPPDAPVYDGSEQDSEAAPGSPTEHAEHVVGIAAMLQEGLAQKGIEL